MQRKPEGGVFLAPLNLADIALAFEPEPTGESLLREAEFVTERRELHPAMFSHSERRVNRKVLPQRDDLCGVIRQYPPMANTAFGKNLRRLRLDRPGGKMTLEAITAATGIAKGYLSDLESGKKDQVSPARAAKIAEALGCEVADLWSESAAPQEDPTTQATIVALHKITDPEKRRLALTLVEQIAKDTGTNG